ncbi:hypothetical protein K2224_01450 [Streptomyces sp. BHT-5-2]|uniref:hypothetical protein n=1 Tax=Streptomyces sp. BHT-5-2 TaxID=2866715 RepID=UPI001C8DBA5A|nr:hypothetical protein [Streptomyces sp. BHT-5-2]QZL02048.1 hypothetical protein K2224_01450 [Streptomyces sp. BHT-5-2]
MLAVLCSREIVATIELGGKECAELPFEAADVRPHASMLGGSASYLELQRVDPLQGGLQGFFGAW